MTLDLASIPERFEGLLLLAPAALPQTLCRHLWEVHSFLGLSGPVRATRTGPAMDDSVRSVKKDARGAMLRCLFCGWWVAGGRKPPRNTLQIPTLPNALRALVNHVAYYHARVL
jgi:hypothetical protein